MVDIRKGASQKPASTERLIQFFRAHPDLSGTLYTGYPILYVAGESLTIDALWVSKEYGILIFDIVEGTILKPDRQDFQDDIFSKVKALLMPHKALSIRRTFSVLIETITFAPACKSSKYDYNVSVTDEELLGFIKGLPAWENDEVYDVVVAVIQSVIKLKIPNKRINIKKPDSRGARIRELESTISNLDQQQEKAVIEFFEGVQRIRGLAGSGKTIVLALKAAYLHAQNPDWKIAVTYYTRSLRKQFEELIERFCIEKKGELPNWSKLTILHAWGSTRQPGIYYNLCKDNGLEYLDFSSAKRGASGGQDPFHYICDLALASGKSINQKYDAILVDEAQDLSEPFLKICFQLLNEPKRLIYAYDELQKLSEGSPLGNPNNIFGRDADDIMLRKCYRNSRPVLVTAHALGFGVYRQAGGLVQFFDQPQLWKDVGYEVKSGSLTPKSQITLYRSKDSSPEYLENVSKVVDDILAFKTFNDSTGQADWVADEIVKNITEDELLHKDIIVINPLAWTTKSEVAVIRAALMRRGVNSHIAGEYNADIFLQDDSITFTQIYRAKGNEAPMVYIINAHDCYENTGFFGARALIKKRNTLFTAITRSKAWVRVCGIGPAMDKLAQEYNEVKSRSFELSFVYPTKEEIDRMNVIHRDLTESERRKITNDTVALKALRDIVRKIEGGESFVEDYPEDVRPLLKGLLQKQ